MRIKVRGGGYRFTIPVPLFVIKFKWVRRLIKKNTQNKGVDFIDIDKFIPMMYKELKNFKKHNKRFVLVDVQSSDGDKVKIIL